MTKRRRKKFGQNFTKLSLSAMEKVLEAVKYLSAPFSSEADDIDKAESAASLLTALIEKCLTKLGWDEVPNVDYMENSQMSPSWKLTCTTLQVLTDLRKYIEEEEANQSVEEKSIEILSLQSQHNVQNCVEIIIGFGIIPYLVPGVGVPDKLRKTHVKLDLFSDVDRNVSPLHQFHRLSHVVENLLQLCENPSFRTLILPQYNCDILACLLQLCKSPLTKPTSDNPSSPSHQHQDKDESQSKNESPVEENVGDTEKSKNTSPKKSDDSSSRNKSSTPLTLDEYEEVMSRRTRLNILFQDKLLSSTSGITGEMLVHSLLIIGSSMKPRWIGKSCYEILYSILLSTEKEGLKIVSRTILASLGRSSLWKVSHVISNIVTEAIRLDSPPSPPPPSPPPSQDKNDDDDDDEQQQTQLREEIIASRVTSISTQAYDMLLVNCTVTSQGKDMDNLEASEIETRQCLTTIAIACGLTLFRINQKVTEKYFWNKVLEIDKLQHCTLPVTELLLTVGPAMESIIEDLGVSESPEKILNVLELILNKLTIEMASSTMTGDEYEFSQSVFYCLHILETLCETSSSASFSLGTMFETTTNQRSSSNLKTTIKGHKQKDFWDDLKRFVPYLQKFQETCHLGLSDSGIPALAENILILIETRGQGLDEKRRTKKKVKELSRFEIAMGDVASPIIPIKGHGLLELKRLVETKDTETLQNEKRLLHIFLREIRNDDSYIYLNAISGLSTLGLEYHTIVVPVLIQEYGGLEGSQSSKIVQSSSSLGLMKGGTEATEEQARFRMKIGEALVKIVQRLGDIAPVYRVPITNVCFQLVRDEDPLIRASSLSNLGELCHLLMFSLGVILTEVWHCVESLLAEEKHVEVRRAALHLIVLLLRGIEKDFSPKYLVEDQVIGGYLRDVQRLLIQIKKTETDPVASTHTQLALKEIELIVEKICTLFNNLEYNVRV